ncbi:MAG: sigma-70 family RNA polymerase sigma factor [Prevotella sp.]|nr:sigma-70 family RNA polymerase sigma factor [Prevotella sp.]MBO7538972.1 sigma-70 family RNA polymerase sigma factor [Prevotella sp.]
MTIEEYQNTAQRLRSRLTEQARHYLMDDDEADDAVQDALLRLWQMHERLKLPIDGLAVVITRNICIDLLRRRHRIANIELADSLDNDSDHERIERLMSVVDTLPDFQQTLLRLRHMEGMEMEDLAKLLQMTEPAVRKALSRARMAVRDRYLKTERR